MASRLNPYIGFVDNAREAMEFYQSVFGGKLTISTFGEFGVPDATIADKVMHSMLETTDGYTLMASDTPPGVTRRQGDNISVSLSGDDADQLRGYWERLSAGGAISLPLQKQMWGDEFGQCTDQFGISWLVNIAAPKA